MGGARAARRSTPLLALVSALHPQHTLIIHSFTRCCSSHVQATLDRLWGYTGPPGKDLCLVEERRHWTRLSFCPHSHPTLCPHTLLCNFTALDTGLRHVHCFVWPKMLADVMQVKASSVFALSGWPSCPSIMAVRREFPGQLDPYGVGLS